MDAPKAAGFGVKKDAYGKGGDSASKGMQTSKLVDTATRLSPGRCTMKRLERLFSAAVIGGVPIRNRIVMPPMTTMMAEEDGSISQQQIDYYEARARGGVGLIIFELMRVDRYPSYIPKAAALCDDKFIPRFGDLVKVVHAHGSRIVPQIAHIGPESLCFLEGVQPVGPSPILSRMTGQVSRELAVDEIGGIVDEFVQAARRAGEAGCDGIELHAAHSYLLAGSFVSALRNRRTDAYGGNANGRTKLLVEIVKAIRTRMGQDFAILLRISGEEQLPGGRDILETQYVVHILEDAGVDAFHISSGVYLHLQWRINPPIGTPYGINTGYSAAVKQVTDRPVIAVGRINDPRFAEHVLERNLADFVAMGRPLLADPDLPEKAQQGRFEDIAPCVGCGLGCFAELAAGRALTCLVNPTVGREKEMAIEPTSSPRKVVVAGGGPGGLEAARILALRGHDVTLFERTGRLGGQLHLAAIAPMKQELCQAIGYLSRQVEKSGTNVVLNTDLTVDSVEQLSPDVVVVATGSEPLVPDLPGVHSEKVMSAAQALTGRKASRANNVLVVGGGMVGCEVADHLAYPGDNTTLSRTVVTIVEVRPDIGLDMPEPQRMLLLQRLRDKGVNIITSAAVEEILEDGAVLVMDGARETIRGMDIIVLALGSRSVDSLSKRLQGTVDQVYVIGDAREPRRALEAIAEGSAIGRCV